MSAARSLNAALAALVFAAAAACATPGKAQTTVNPPEDAVSAPPVPDDPAAMWDDIRAGAAGRSSLPDPAAARLIQVEGMVWRDRNDLLIKPGGLAILGLTVLGLVLYWIYRGPIRTQAQPGRRRIKRFDHAQRMAHWLVGLSFVLLALSGLIVTYGRLVLAPALGPETFALVTWGAKLIHGFVGPAFAAGLIMMLVFWVRHALPNRMDVEWLARGGGLLSRSAGRPRAGRLNAGQKLLFWITIAGGGYLSVTGAYLLLPFALTDVFGMQMAQLGHAAAAIVMTSVALIHLYFGTVGVQGALASAASGEVDVNWAKEHHSEWVKEINRAKRSASKAKRPSAEEGAARSRTTPRKGAGEPRDS